MTNKMKLRITNIFRSPLCSRRSKTLSDVTQHPFFYPQNNQHHHHHLFQLFSPKKPPPFQPFPSICRPKIPQTQHTHLIPRTKLAGDTPIFSFPATTKHTPKPRQRKTRKKRNNSHLKNKKFEDFLDSVSGNYSNYWFTTSDDENEEAKDDDRTTLFSSKSLSSSGSSEELDKAGFKDSFAVVKRSSDPYNDFRTSMVEMIVERQLFGAKDLEHLLQCFLALNSTCHHLVIVEVFTEIWETLFSDWQ
ncbi:Transcription repressor [Heracleum sosnowskyi]|uniref:Transcription repressor n=1 Tax=Heracleum sosnowskyi TaxID=360622 RepID=A0AAD8MA86_9APIA|nr:Transcription repressor [Heracleum sosnowskyi]